MTAKIAVGTPNGANAKINQSNMLTDWDRKRFVASRPNRDTRLQSNQHAIVRHLEVDILHSNSRDEILCGGICDSGAIRKAHATCWGHEWYLACPKCLIVLKNCRL